MSRWLKCTAMYFNTDWNKYDDRLMKAVERGEVEKVAAVLSKKGITPTKLDVEGRSAFHLAATRGHLDCLNLILGHGVDVTAADATGKNALHLAARNGQSLCVQKLLQHSCPVGNVDLQGRTALHDAVMAGCSSSVKLLCDNRASVNAHDFDGRTPLVLATQMCHPRICQLLLDRGADIRVQDKQHKTALILGCEYACKDAVEVLLRNGADVTAVDGFGHDGYHYARLSKNHELVSLVKSYLDSALKVKEATRMEQKKRQLSLDATSDPSFSRDHIIHDLEKQNESQQETLRRYHQEQRTLMDKVSMLQKQLSQEKSVVEDIHKEREHLKRLLAARDKEEGTRASDTVKVQPQSCLGDYSGQSVIKGRENVIVRQSQSLDSAQILQPTVLSRSLSRPLELSQPVLGAHGEVEALRQELSSTRKQQEAAQDELGHLQALLVRKTQDCEELAQSRDSVKRDADRQIQELEGALGDVQKRMLDSEAKVKQLQAHVVAVKEHLGSQMLDDLKAQLSEVKAKYEGASAEVGRVRNHLKQSEKALEEYKKSERHLAEEADGLMVELNVVREERDKMSKSLLEAETRAQETAVRLSTTVPGEKFDNMKNLLTNAVDEKERQLAELRDDYDRVLEEVAELHREAGGRDGVPLAEHERMRDALEEQSSTLRMKLAEVTSKCQTLIRELEEAEDERELLREELQELTQNLQTQYVPVDVHEELRRSLALAAEELREQLEEVTERKGWTEEQVKRLQEEKASLSESVSKLKSSQVSCEKYEREAATLSARAAGLEKDLKSLQEKYREKERELELMVAEKASLTRSLEGEFIAKEVHEQAQAVLGEALEKAKAEIAKLEEDGRIREEELKNMKEGNAMLKEEFENVQAKLVKDYISLVEHEETKSKLNRALAEVKMRAEDAASKHQAALEGSAKLQEEIESQKRELDTIHEAIHSKFVPLSTVEEKDRSFSSAMKDMTEKLAQVQEKYEGAKADRERERQQKEAKKAELVLRRQELEANFIPSEKHREVEDAYKVQVEALSLKLVELEQQHMDATVRRAELEEKNALCATEIESLQQRLESELVKQERFKDTERSLGSFLEEARNECERLHAMHDVEAQRTQALERELRSCSSDADLLARHGQAREALERDVADLRLALREAEETSAQRAEDVATLQGELLRATHALDELRAHEGQVAQLRAEKQRLEDEADELGDRLSSLEEQCDDLYREAAQARESECRARVEMETLQNRSTSIEKEIRELKEKYDESLTTIGDLQKRIQMYSEQTEAKDKRITELLADVERLKQALNGLSQLAYTGNMPNKRHTQHMDALQAQVKSLQQQLADAERQHREVVSIYRTHLLSAAQGHMDEDVQAALLQIIRMRQQFVC
ncbi:uveal autoantigen with coiled-coil domains and ankyrin repeats protein isoform X2 [Electrophorus electricus]|uniref:uveal autoantigen with coiled-coil domains and ankyrin repeats protein isoform X2 n=1 Tax=Electrophorus electricus TaxID=8005 RepID=UPI0015D0C04F|nr:uveal autoantigen with coiled-coil domains and ankyrin repeats protein isoform X2 [Electrophorus electricus]